MRLNVDMSSLIELEGPGLARAGDDKLRAMHRLAFTCLIAAMLGGCVNQAVPPAAPPPAAAGQRVPSRPYLNMPQTAEGSMPALLSQTGAFSDARALTPARGLLPYEL